MDVILATMSATEPTTDDHMDVSDRNCCFHTGPVSQETMRCASSSTVTVWCPAPSLHLGIIRHHRLPRLCWGPVPS